MKDRGVTIVIHTDGDLDSRQYRVPVWAFEAGKWSALVVALLVVFFFAFAGPIGRAMEATKGGAPVRRAAREDDVRPGAKVFVPRLNAHVEVLERASRDQVRVAGTTIGTENRQWLVSAMGFELEMELAPLLVFFHTLFAKGLILDGWRGWYYVLQRTLAETLLSLRLIEAKLSPEA